MYFMNYFFFQVFENNTKQSINNFGFDDLPETSMFVDMNR